MKLCKQIIIHTGFHKTASSSIQYTLADNRGLLAQNGYVYPEIQIDSKRFYNQSIPLYGLYTAKPEEFKQYWYHSQIEPARANRLIRQKLNADLAKHTKLIFSDEFVSGLSEIELAQMKSDFENNGFKVRVISFVRDPYNLMVSVAQQMAKSDTIQKVIQSNRPDKELSKIRALIKAFGEQAEFYNFETACAHQQGPVGFFFDLLGIHLEERKMLKVNEGISLQAARLVSHINGSCPIFSTASSMNPLRKNFDIVPLLSISGDRFALTEEEYAVISSKAAPAKKQISDLLGESFFPESAPVSVTVNEVWSSEQISQILERAPVLDLNILLRVHDYFADLERVTGVPYLQKISTLDALIRQRLDRDCTPSLVDKKYIVRLALQRMLMPNGFRSMLRRLIRRVRA